jgi:hypothetical protein
MPKPRRPGSTAPARETLCALSVLALSFFVLSLSAQPSAAQERVVVVASNDAAAQVFSQQPDTTVRIGLVNAPLTLPAPSARLVVVPAIAAGWERDAITLALPPRDAAWGDAAPGDTLRFRADFPHLYRFESVPYGASVVDAAGDTLGATPLTLSYGEPLTSRVTFALAGFRPEAVDQPGDALWNRHVVRLEPLGEGSEVSGVAVLGLTPPKRRRWIDAAALTTALVGGAVAVHYKFKADRRYDEYTETTDPALRSDIRRFDTYSAVGLGAMQTGVGVFAIRLILR